MPRTTAPSGATRGAGETLDPDELGDGVESPEDTIAALSHSGNLGRELEDRTVAIIRRGTPNHGSGHLDPRLDTGVLVNGLLSGTHFGATTGTPCGAYVVRREDAADAASVVARGGWTRGVFAYAPNDAPSAGDIPDRGEAAFRGSAVVAAPVTARKQEGGDTLLREDQARGGLRADAR